MGLCHIIFGDSELLVSESFTGVKTSPWSIQNSGQDRAWPVEKCVELFVKISSLDRCYIDASYLVFIHHFKIH